MQYLGLMLASMVTTVLLSIDARAYPRQSPNYFHHQVWSTEDGLPQASVHALLQSHEGYLWIATEEGAARFDGQSFRVLNHATVPAFATSDMSSLAEDQSGDIWFGTSDGLVRKHGEDYRRFSEPDGLPSDEIVALAASPSDLLVLTTGGLAAWKHDHFERIATDEVITGLAGTERGTILISNKGGVYLWNHGQLLAIVPAMHDEPRGVAKLRHATSKRSGPMARIFSPPPSPSQKRIWQACVEPSQGTTCRPCM